MKVLVCPELTETGSGLTSTICYDNPDFERGLNVMFSISGKEKIEQVEIGKEGITVRIAIK